MPKPREPLPASEGSAADWRGTRFDRCLSKDLFYREGVSVILNRFEPGGSNFAHKHPYRQLRYILEGNITVNGRTYGPGAVIDFPANTIYEVSCAEGGMWLVVQMDVGKGEAPPDRSRLERKDGPSAV